MLLLGIFLLLVLIICLLSHLDHNLSAKVSLMELSKIQLPPESRLLNEGWEVGNFISGTGSDIDSLAYRAFASSLPPEEVENIFAGKLENDPSLEIRAGIFRLDIPKHPRAGLTESYLRENLGATTSPTYVIYRAQRIDDGVWDWRGW